MAWLAGCHQIFQIFRQVEAEGELELPESKVRFSETVPGAWPVSRKKLPGDDRFKKGAEIEAEITRQYLEIP